MDDIDSMLDHNDVLSLIHQYELLRDEGRCFIHIREVLSSSKFKFVAWPSLIMKDNFSEEFIGRGDTREKALKECLSKIKGVSIKSIFPDT